jgi:hypothetical protein
LCGNNKKYGNEYFLNISKLFFKKKNLIFTLTYQNNTKIKKKLKKNSKLTETSSKHHVGLEASLPADFYFGKEMIFHCFLLFLFFSMMELIRVKL